MPTQTKIFHFHVGYYRICKTDSLFAHWVFEDNNPSASLHVKTMTEQFKPKGILKGHSGWVTQIATTQANPDMILSASRGTARDLTIMT